MRTSVAKLFALTITGVFFLQCQVFSQTTGKFVKLEDEALNQLPANTREPLIERLEDYVNSLNVGNLNRIYDLRPDACRSGLNKEEWLKKARYNGPGRILSFLIVEVYPDESAARKWVAQGCATYRHRNKKIRYRAFIRLELINGEWFICDNGVAVEGADSQFEQCADGI